MTDWTGIPDTAAARAATADLAGDDCPWAILDAAIDEIDRLRAPIPTPTDEPVDPAEARQLKNARCPRCKDGLALGTRGWLLCPTCDITFRMLKSGRLVRRPWVPEIDTPYGVLKFFGADCTDTQNCGNFTYGSFVCDSCNSDQHTIPVYIVADDDTERPAVHAIDPGTYRRALDDWGHTDAAWKRDVQRILDECGPMLTADVRDRLEDLTQ